MAKSKSTVEQTDRDTADSGIEQQLLKFSEQLGWLVGTVQAKSEGWLDRKSLTAQVGRIRDSAAELVNQLGERVSEGVGASRSVQAQNARGGSPSTKKSQTADGGSRSAKSSRKSTGSQAPKSSPGASSSRSLKGSQDVKKSQKSGGAQESRAGRGSGSGAKATGAEKRKIAGGSNTPAMAAEKVDRGLVDAPGKRHRQAPPIAHGIKKSDLRIPNEALARRMRRRSPHG